MLQIPSDSPQRAAKTLNFFIIVPPPLISLSSSLVVKNPPYRAQPARAAKRTRIRFCDLAADLAGGRAESFLRGLQSLHAAEIRLFLSRPADRLSRYFRGRRCTGAESFGAANCEARAKPGTPTSRRRGQRP